MHNHFREHIDAGLKQLAANQGKGLPTAPDTTMVASEVPPAAPDTNADSEIQNQRKQADQTEQEVVRQTSSGVPAEVNDKRRVPSRSMSVRA